MNVNLEIRRLSYFSHFPAQIEDLGDKKRISENIFL